MWYTLHIETQCAWQCCQLDVLDVVMAIGGPHARSHRINVDA
jgi:hypothetical protein